MLKIFTGFNFQIAATTLQRWEDGTFIEQGLPPVCWLEYDAPWVDYEGMKAQMLVTIPEETGLIRVKFPARATEDVNLHAHPHSDRIITVTSGNGYFKIADGEKTLPPFGIQAGMRIWMPRGVIHTFMAGEGGLVIDSIHNPFIPFDDPRCLVYPG